MDPPHYPSTLHIQCIATTLRSSNRIKNVFFVNYLGIRAANGLNCRLIRAEKYHSPMVTEYKTHQASITSKCKLRIKNLEIGKCWHGVWIVHNQIK